MRTLGLLRHAKADYPEGVDDHDRPLTSRGRRDAREVGRVLLATERVPDLVVCSDAARTRQTWEQVEKVVARPVTVRYEPTLYLAEARAVLGLLRALPAQSRRALLVGHNPSTHELARWLSGESAGTRLVSYPTATLAVLRVPGDWSALGEGTCELLDVTVCRAG